MSARKAPIESAKNYNRGTVKTGLDGNEWMVIIDVNKHKRWVSCSARTVDCMMGHRIPRSMRVKDDRYKNMRASRRPCNYPYPAHLFNKNGVLRKDRSSRREVRRIRKEYNCDGSQRGSMIVAPSFAAPITYPSVVKSAVSTAPVKKTLLGKRPFKETIDYTMDFPFDEIPRLNGEYVQSKATNAEINLATKLFNEAKTYTGVLRLNTLFIKGTLKATPYHGGPLEIDSQKLINDLIQLHEYGLLTHNGQAGWHGCALRSDPSEWFATIQKPFLTFLMPKSSFATRLMNVLKTNPKLILRVIDGAGPRVVYSSQTDPYLLTRYKVAPNLMAIEKEAWTDYTAQPMRDAHPGETETSIPLIDNNRSRYMYFFVAYNEWCAKPSLEKIVLAAVKKVGVPKKDILK